MASGGFCPIEQPTFLSLPSACLSEVSETSPGYYTGPPLSLSACLTLTPVCLMLFCFPPWMVHWLIVPDFFVVFCLPLNVLFAITLPGLRTRPSTRPSTPLLLTMLAK